MKTAVYRIYDADDVLLYVGMSNNPGKRLFEHKATAPWAQDALRMEVDWYETRGEAFTNEGVSIRSLNPVHNKNNGRKTNGKLSDELAGCKYVESFRAALVEVEEYAEACGMSPEHVCRLATGDPRKYERFYRQAVMIENDLRKIAAYMAANPVASTPEAAA